MIKVKKRSGKLNDFDEEKIKSALQKTTSAVNEIDTKVFGTIFRSIIKDVKELKKSVITTTDIDEIVENTLLSKYFIRTAKEYIYQSLKKSGLNTYTDTLCNNDWNISINAIEILKERYLQKDETPLKLLKRVSRYFGRNKSEKDRFYEMFVNKRGISASPSLFNADTSMKMFSPCFCLSFKEDSLESIFDTLKMSSIIEKFGGGVGYNFSNLRENGCRISTTNSGSSGILSWLRIFDLASSQISQGGKRRGANMGIINCMSNDCHPELLNFISLKMKEHLSTFNLSVMVDNYFMNSIEDNDVINLVSPHTKQIIRKIPAQKIFNMIALGAHTTGDPGMLFYDRMNDDNYYSPDGKDIRTVNPCITEDSIINTTEGYKSIKELVGRDDIWVMTHLFNGNINIYRKAYDIKKTRKNEKIITIEMTDNSRFSTTLDHEFYLENEQKVKAKDLNVNEMLFGFSQYHRIKKIIYEEIKEDVYNLTIPELHNYFILDKNYLGEYTGVLVKNCGESPLLENESCDLGSLNLAKYKDDNQLKYDTETMCILLNRIIDKNKMPYKELQKAMLATRKIGIGLMGWGDYCLLHNLKYGSEESLNELKRLLDIIKQSAIETSCNLDYPKIYKDRCNANLLSIAPCGTIATLLGASFSIEPPFGWIYERRILDGSIQLEENEIFKERFQDLDSETLLEIKNNVSIKDIDVFSKKEKEIYRVAFEILPVEHLNTQGAAQKIVDLGVSKTINLPETSTIEDIKNIYFEAWKLECKGITVYRNNSKPDQPISWNLDLACATGKCDL